MLANAKCLCVRPGKPLTAFLGVLFFAIHVHAQPAALDRAQAHLNAITTLTADFTQISPDGGAGDGKLYLQRPGKMRWVYYPPNPILMVSNGKTLIYHDTQMDEVTYLDMDDTLAAFITKPNIDFSDPELRVDNISDKPDILRFTVRKAAEPDEGALTMIFRKQPMRLYQMLVRDGSGEVTAITLENLQLGMALDKELFELKREFIKTK